MQSLERPKEFYIEIAKACYPEFAINKFYVKQFGKEYWYYDLQQVDVVSEAKLHADKYDFAFNVICRFGMQDRKGTGKHQWYKSPRGAIFTIGLPRIIVVQRETINLAPEQILMGMKKVFKANVLLLDTYSFPVGHLRLLSHLAGYGITVIFRKEPE